MHFTAVFAAFCFSSLVLAHGASDKKQDTAPSSSSKDAKNHTMKGMSDDFKCKEMSRLTKLTELANNATKLAELEKKSNLTATDINKIKEAATNATSKLTMLTSNTTLVSECAMVDASTKFKADCRNLERLTLLTNLVSNATALSEIATKHNFTAKQMDEIKSEAANATAKLTKLQSNATLVSGCKELMTTMNDKGNKTQGASSSSSTSSSSTGPQKQNSNGGNGLQVLGSGVFGAGMAVLVAMLMV